MFLGNFKFPRLVMIKNSKDRGAAKYGGHDRRRFDTGIQQVFSG